MLTATTGCDNVAWGGWELELRSPPVADTATAAGDDDAVEVDSPVKVPGPVLLAGERDGERASLVVVGEILDGRPSTFPDPAFPGDSARLAELTAPGTEWTIFSEGVRVGRMIVDAAEPAPRYCSGSMTVSGVVELVPSASGAVRLLALPASDGAAYAHGPYEEHQHDYDERVATLSLAGEAIPRYGATWPAGGTLDIREHIQSFQLADAARRWVAATFVNQDVLDVAAPGGGAYALFVIGRPAGGDYVEAFSWFRSVDAEGKGAPRYHDHLDWDGDGMDEILLDVFGANRRWFAGLDRSDGEWVRSFENPCGSGSTVSN